MTTTDPTPETPGALDGIRVLDFTQMMLGPFATQILADLGADAQRSIVLPADGQPGSRSVWHDHDADAVVGGFFSGTRATIENSHLRPRDSWWPAYQEAAGLALVDLLRTGASPSTIHEDLTRLLDGARTEETVQ